MLIQRQKLLSSKDSVQFLFFFLQKKKLQDLMQFNQHIIAIPWIIVQVTSISLHLCVLEVDVTSNQGPNFLISHSLHSTPTGLYQGFPRTIYIYIYNLSFYFLSLNQCHFHLFKQHSEMCQNRFIVVKLKLLSFQTQQPKI